MKSQELQSLNQSCRHKLQEYYGYEVPLVFGDGNPDSKIVLVGEAPGKTEVELGKPFVGQAGKNLEEFITILDIEREELYITNVVKLRPIKVNPDTGRESNRPPTKDETRIFTDIIEKELSIIRPALVASLGNVALRCILKDDRITIGNLHGTPINVKFADVEFVLFPLYHPASIIYNRSLRDVYLQDLHRLRDYMRENKLV